MERKIYILAEHITKGEISQAKQYAEKVFNSIENQNYAKCFLTVLLTETAIKLKNDIKNFYCDINEVQAQSLVQSPSDANRVIDYLNSKMRESRRADEIIIYKKAKEYIDENISSAQLSVSDCADYTGVSQIALSRVFSRYMHILPSEYICRKRINFALKLLKDGEISVNDASEKTGFFSTATFIRTFKRFLGTTPGKYRFMK